MSGASTTRKNCPCCGARMTAEEGESKILFRCPSCGLTDVRLKGGDAL